MSKRQKNRIKLALAAQSPPTRAPDQSPQRFQKGPDEANTLHRFRTFSLMVVAAGLAAYLQTLAADFTYDDIHIVRDNPVITHLSRAPEIFRLNYWDLREEFRDKSLYRPFTILTYAINYRLNGTAPWGYHLVNVLLHALAAWVLFRFLYDLFGNLNAAFIAALWFAVHPIHAEAVAGVVGRAEILSFLGVATTAWCYHRGQRAFESGARFLVYAGWLVGSVAAYAMGMFSKELGILAPAVVVLSEIAYAVRCGRFRITWPALATFAAYSAVLWPYLKLRAAATTATVVVFGLEDLSPALRIATALRVCVQYAAMLVYPSTLSADYSERSAVFATGWTDPAVLVAILLLGGAAFFVVWSWKRMPDGWWGVLFFMGTLFPVSNLPFLIGVIKADRLLYTPSAGFLAAAAAALVYWLDDKQSRSTLWLIVFLSTAMFFARTCVRNLDWRNNFTLAAATLRVSPNSLTMNTIMGEWYRAHGRNDLARPYLAKVKGQGARSTDTLYNLGNLELDEKNYAEAIRLYRELLQSDPGHLGALNNLGRALSDSGAKQEAATTFRELMARSPDQPGAYVNLVNLYVVANDLTSALPIAEEALRRFPDIDAVHWNAGVIYEKLGRLEEASNAYRRAAALNPGISQQRDIKRKF